MDIFHLKAILGMDTSEYEDGIGNAKSLLGGLGNAMGTAAKVGAAAIGVATTAVGTLAAESVNAYADYEQLEGGIETLFGDAAPKVMANAEKAFKTAGQSMNDYMDTSIQSAAALISSLEGDQAKAADLMDMSIVDMADNVNKMGTSMEGVQNAYRGFSRGNFTMLDNLALGFAGTKEGMQQLLDKAKEISGIDYNIDSYADIVQAIHVVQEDMGIAGTTMKEGTETIAGSIATLKGAWTNLVAGFANPDADLGALIDQVVESAETVLNNLQPIIEKAIGGITTFVEKAVPIIAEELPKIIDTALPALLDAGTKLISALISALPSLLSTLISALPSVISGLLDAIKGLGSQLSGSFMDMFSGLKLAIYDNLPSLMTKAAEFIGNFLQELTNPERLQSILQFGIMLVESIAQGILDAIPVLIEALPQIIENIVTFLTNAFPMIIGSITNLVFMIVNALPDIISALVDALPQIIETIISALLEMIPRILDAGIELLMALVDAIPTVVIALAEALPDIVTGICDALINNIDQIIEAGVELLSALVEDLPTIVANIIKAIPKIAKALFDAIIKCVPKLIEAGNKLMAGLAKGILSGGKVAVDAIKNAGSKVVDKAKSLFGIHSPSKVFEELGDYIDQGLALGIEGNVDKVSNAMNAMQDAASFTADDFNDGWETSTSVIGKGSGSSAVSNSQPVVAILELDKVQLGKVVFDLNNAETQRIGVNLASGGY